MRWKGWSLPKSRNAFQTNPTASSTNDKEKHWNSKLKPHYHVTFNHANSSESPGRMASSSCWHDESAVKDIAREALECLFSILYRLNVKQKKWFMTGKYSSAETSFARVNQLNGKKLMRRGLAAEASSFLQSIAVINTRLRCFLISKMSPLRVNKVIKLSSHSSSLSRSSRVIVYCCFQRDHRDSREEETFSSLETMPN